MSAVFRQRRHGYEDIDEEEEAQFQTSASASSIAEGGAHGVHGLHGHPHPPLHSNSTIELRRQRRSRLLVLAFITILVVTMLFPWKIVTVLLGSSGAASSATSGKAAAAAGHPHQQQAGQPGQQGQHGQQQTFQVPPPQSHIGRAHDILTRTPILDGHWDLPFFARTFYSDDLSHFPYGGKLKGQIDMPRIRRGGVGGFWSIAFVECPDNDVVHAPDWGEGEGGGNSQVVRDTLEQIDLTRQLPEYFGIKEGVALARTPQEFRENWKEGKVSHWIGLEGGHHLGNSLATLRLYASLGVTYLTLTHNCANVFADSAIVTSGPEEIHGGLSHFGHRLIAELNRLGVAVDLSHTSPKTQLEALKITTAPVIFSHSGAKGVYDHPRNVGDDVLQALKESGRDYVIGVPFLSDFVKGAGNSTLYDVVEHIEYLSVHLGGRKHVALGSDFDGAIEFSRGLEDARRYPRLIAALLEKGWSEEDVAGLASENWLRVIEGIQERGRVLREEMGLRADMRPWHGRTDLIPNARPTAVSKPFLQAWGVGH